MNTDTETLRKLADKLSRFNECVEDGADVDIGRDWLDALTVLGLLERTQRSPAIWMMTDAGNAILAALTPSPEAQTTLTGEPAKGACASDQCDGPAVALFESGSVISKYCRDCFNKVHPPAPQPEAPEAPDQLEVMREALERLDKLTDEAPFDFGLIKLVVSKALAALSAAGRKEGV